MPTKFKVNAIYFLLLLSMSTYPGTSNPGTSKDSQPCKTDTSEKKQPQKSSAKHSKTVYSEINQNVKDINLEEKNIENKNIENKNIEILETSLNGALDAVKELKKSSSRPNKEDITLKVLNKIMTAGHTCHHFSSKIYATPFYLVIPIKDKKGEFFQLVIIEEVKGKSLYTLTTNQIYRGINSRLRDLWKSNGIMGMLSKETHDNISNGTLRPRLLESVDQLPDHLNLEALQQSLRDCGYQNITIELSGNDKTKLPD